MALPPVMRSVLFVPGTRADRFSQAFSVGADAVILDLEDAVEAGSKEEARREVGRWLSQAPASTTATLVRLNAHGSAALDADLDWLPRVAAHIDAIVVPKAEDASSLEHVADWMPGRRVVPLLETARGVLNAPEILRAHADVAAVLFGAEDLTAELGIPRTLDGEELLYARSRVLLAAAAAGTDTLDAVWVNLKDTDGLRRDAVRARALGFRGKMAIHPDQVPIINEVFSPTAEEIEAARRILDAAATSGSGAFRLDDRMVDAPVIRRARKILGS